MSRIGDVVNKNMQISGELNTLRSHCSMILFFDNALQQRPLVLYLKVQSFFTIHSPDHQQDKQKWCQIMPSVIEPGLTARCELNFSPLAAQLEKCKNRRKFRLKKRVTT